MAAAADEVSEAVANFFGAYGKEYQSVVGQVEAYHAQFQQSLAAAAHAYVNTGIVQLLVISKAISQKISDVRALIQ